MAKKICLFFAAWASTLIGISAASSTETLFRGKIINAIVGYNAGGSIDIVARVFADYMSRRLPGTPRVVIRNVPGAEGVIALNNSFATAKGDGLTVSFGGVPDIDPIHYRDAQATYDPRKVNFIGGLGSSGTALIIRNEAQAGLRDKSQGAIIMGAPNAIRQGMWSAVFGSEYLNWNIRWVFGYPGTNELKIALLRNEIDMTSLASPDTISEILETGRYTILAQTGRNVAGRLVGRPTLGNTPLITELLEGVSMEPDAIAAVAYWKSMLPVGQWLGVAGEAPKPILEAYRQFFTDVVQDIEFSERIKKVYPETIPMSWADMTSAVEISASTSPRALAYLGELRNKYTR